MPKLFQGYSAAVLFMLSFILVTSSSCITQAPIGISSTMIKDEQVNRLKDRTVVFIVPQSQYDYFDDYKQLIPTAWTLTPIEIIRYKDIEKYRDASKYSYFDIHGIQTTVQRSSGGSYTNTHYYLSLSSYYTMGSPNKKARESMDELCRVELYPEFGAGFTSSKRNVQEQLYLRSSIRNFSLPYMMAYLRFVQKNVEQKKSPTVYAGYTEPLLRKKLAGDTLYIPEGLLFDRNKWTGNESEKNENFFSNYKGKYKIVSNKELIDIVNRRSSSNKPLFLFEYVLSSTDKFVSVLDVTSGTIVYRRYTPITYNIKEKDLVRILED